MNLPDVGSTSAVRIFSVDVLPAPLIPKYPKHCAQERGGHSMLRSCALSSSVESRGLREKPHLPALNAERNPADSNLGLGPTAIDFPEVHQPHHVIRLRFRCHDPHG